MKKILLASLLLLISLCFMFSFKVSLSAKSNMEAHVNNLEIKEDISKNGLRTPYMTIRGYENYPIYVDVKEFLTYNKSTYQILETLNDLPYEILSSINDDYESDYPYATRLASASARYNCHSYAWYEKSTNNIYWLYSPAAFYNDSSYIEVTTPRPGDLICYFNNNGTPSDYTDDNNRHSGIVLSYNSSIPSNNVCGNSNQVTVESKWGAAGLFQHSGDYCPYVSTHGGDSNYVKYYRPRTNYSYNLTQYGSTITRSFYAYNSGSQLNRYEMYELNVLYQKNYQMTISSNYKLYVRLFDINMNMIFYDYNNSSNGGTYTVNINQNLSVGYYYLRVQYWNDNSGTITTTIHGHQHSYNQDYEWNSYLQHYASCECGASHLEPHVVSQSAYNSGSQYATCLLCGGLASIGFIGPNFLAGDSDGDGLFVLPNGIIVVADNKVEELLNKYIYTYCI